VIALLDGSADTVTGLAQADLALIWFGLLGVLLIGYAILDGFDLGVGILSPFVARTDDERRVALNSIGPVWDGNEVWLVTFGGALFAAFPEAYATILSAFYDVFFVVLMGLVLRAVSIEFRGKLASRGWRRVWDGIFSASSFTLALLFGAAVGNAMVGIAMDERFEFTGDTSDLFGAFPLAAGALSVLLFAIHGGAFLILKSDGAVRARTETALRWLYPALIATFVGATALALTHTSEMTHNLAEAPALWVIPVINAVLLAMLGLALVRRRAGQAFALSCGSIAAFVALLGLALFPNLVKASGEDGVSLTVANAASSARTLEIMLLIAVIGMPLVLTYTGIVYWTFRGKVRIDASSY